jgi:hypothetical protein
MKTKKIFFVTVLSLFLVSCLTEVFVEFNAELNIKLVDKNQNALKNAEVTMERLYNGEKTGIIQQDETNANGEFQHIIQEGNADSRYHSEKPVELNNQEKFIETDHEFYCEFKKEGYISKDTTIIIKNTQKLNFTIKMDQIPE